MDNSRQTISGSERLKSRTSINRVFSEGKSLFAHPIKLIYLISEFKEQIDSIKFGVSVPKRLHKKAVKRNLLKRRMREAIRKHKIVIKSTEDDLKALSLMYILIDKEESSYESIEKAIVKLNRKMARIINQDA